MSAKRRTRRWKEAQKVQADRAWALGVLSELTKGFPPPKMTESTKVELPEDEERQGSGCDPNTLIEPYRLTREYDR